MDAGLWFASIAGLRVSRLIIGGNPFSGFSHQSPEQDRRMREYYTPERICEELRNAECLGVNTFIGRADKHIVSVLEMYRELGGTIQWIAQTCPEAGAPAEGMRQALAGGPHACYIHGGVMDKLFSNGRLDEAVEAIRLAKSAGVPVGIAGHRPEVFEWAEEHADVDFYMCSHYNPIPRLETASHRSGLQESYLDEDRTAMVKVIAKLSRPVIHYKVMAAGRNNPKDALEFTVKHMRANDAVCVGIYSEFKKDMLVEDVRLLQNALQVLSASG
ncbi:MAG: hypothetical protein ACP5R4_03320 [Armatimonadota bacterium]